MPLPKGLPPIFLSHFSFASDTWIYLNLNLVALGEPHFLSTCIYLLHPSSHEIIQENNNWIIQHRMLLIQIKKEPNHFIYVQLQQSLLYRSTFVKTANSTILLQAFVLLLLVLVFLYSLRKISLVAVCSSRNTSTRLAQRKPECNNWPISGMSSQLASQLYRQAVDGADGMLCNSIHGRRQQCLYT